MDNLKETSDLVVKLNKYKKGEIKDYEFIKTVCEYFDKIKKEHLTNSDLIFLRFIANQSGIPQFFTILENYNNQIDIEDINLTTCASFFNESYLATSETKMLHKFQKEILNKFEKGKENRYILTASTSFGKTYIIYEIIKKMEYKNVVLIFPSIALLAENLDKLMTNPDYSDLKVKYKIHTLSDVDIQSEYNLFIFTPERYISFLEKNEFLKFDFIFIDEIYKIDNDFELDEEIKENERDTAYRLATFFSAQQENDLLLAGPYIEELKESFSLFLNNNSIERLDYNNYEIVNKYYYNLEKTKYISKTDFENISFDKESTKGKQLISVTKKILSENENLIIYVSSKGKSGGAEGYAEKLLSDNIYGNFNIEGFSVFIEHLENRFSSDWIVVRALKKGIGIHHGMVPKYIQKEIINLFNSGKIRVLISTTTITEGVNTSAKYLIIMASKKGEKPLKKFDAKNIAGRAGRFGYHYSGKVIDLSKEFNRVLELEDEKLRYKNYEKEINKNDIDIFFTEEDFLTEQDKINKNIIIKKQKELGIPDEILNKFRVISKSDKMILYEEILALNNFEFTKMKTTIENYHNNSYFDISGFNDIFELIKPIIHNQQLLGLYNKGMNPHCILTYKINSYLKDGLWGLINYNISHKDINFDKAMADSTKFVFNILKYQVVKYLGVFNIIYKYIQSKISSTSFDEVPGLDRMLRKLEYNAISDLGRKVSDYGVPDNIVKYYEMYEKNEKEARRMESKFDKYEREIFSKIKSIIE